MVLKVKLFSLSACILLSVGFSHCVPLPMRTARCQELCAGCKNEDVLSKATCNCTTAQQHALKDSSCLGGSRKFGTPTDGKSTARRKRCTPEELYQLRERIEETKRNIERLRHRQKLPGVDLYPVYYPRQAHSVASYVNPIFKPLDSAKHVLRPAGHFADAGNHRPWQLEASREALRPWRRMAGEDRGQGQDVNDINDSVVPRRHVQRAPMSIPETTSADPVEFLQNRRQLLEENLKMLLKNVGNVASSNARPKDESKLQVDSPEDLNKRQRENDLVPSLNNDNMTAKATPKVGKIAMTAQFHRRNDFVSSSNANNTLSHKLNDLSDTPHINHQLLEENLKMLLKNVGNVTSENSRPKDESKLQVDSTEELNKRQRENDLVPSLNNDNLTAKATSKVGKIAMTAQFHRRNDFAFSSNANNTLSQKLNDLSDSPHINRSNQFNNISRSYQTIPLGPLAAVQLSNRVESTTVISTTDSWRPAQNDSSSTRKQLDVIVDIAVIPNARGDTDNRVGEQMDPLAENEEARRKESFVSQHTPHTLSPPIVLDLNPGYRISRDHEVESDEGGGDVSEHKDRVPSVSKVFILKSFNSENANFGIPKAQDLYLHKKSPTE